jgi:hypothetical protein
MIGRVPVKATYRFRLYPTGMQERLLLGSMIVASACRKLFVPFLFGENYIEW